MNKMFDEIIDNLREQLSKEKLDKINSCKLHLGVFSEPYLTYMLEGSKTIEARFSKMRIMPYNAISEKDIVIVKRSGGNVVAYFTIKKVLFFDLEQYDINDIKKKYQKELCVDEEFWNIKNDSKYATLIFIDKIYPIKPFKINKKGMNTWLIRK